MKPGAKNGSRTGLCTILILLAVVMISITAGCTGSVDDDIEENDTAITEEETATVTPAATEEEEEEATVDTNNVIAIDLVSLYRDVQNDNPLAFEYVFLPTKYLGVGDNGDYEFEGTINDYNIGGDQTNYLGVLFTVKDNESEAGYDEWVYKGLKYDVFSGEEGQNITIKFIVEKEDIPEGKTFIMTGYDLNEIEYQECEACKA